MLSQGLHVSAWLQQIVGTVEEGCLLHVPVPALIQSTQATLYISLPKTKFEIL